MITRPPPLHDDTITQALSALLRGELVGVPTETVYGLGADATNALAIAAIYETKGRPHFNPLISHIANLDDAFIQGVFSPLALRLAEAFWPGPLTLVVPRASASTVCDLACAGLTTIALRVPDHDLTLTLLTQLRRPLAAPSANISGKPSPTLASHVREAFTGRVSFVLDGGPCTVGLESTVVAVSGEQATLLRLGGLSRAEIEAISGPLLTPSDQDKAAPASPGMILRHYAPDAPVLLDQLSAPDGGVLLGFGPIQADPAFNLSPNGDLREAAANLFAYLRAADAASPRAIAVAPIPNQGLGEAINDRLVRAARG
jgi:L-threonylcarbamoyladenylate synthase